MGKLNSCPAAFPVDYPVFNHESPFQSRIIKLPLIKFIFPQTVIGAEGAGTRPSLDCLITLFPDQAGKRISQGITGMLIQIQQLISIHIADINISHIGIHHPVEILLILLISTELLFLFL